MIRLLPDSVANQIAAGEVVQRPSSVVKELLENAVDAKASLINLIIKDSGCTLIQVIDNGLGMSDIDARMAFERHATSKITLASDLEHITTFGFRGEALPSIASVSEVELKTRTKQDDLGTHIIIRASEVISQEAVQCPVGSNFAVKNLFYNIPARRKFLKSDSVELKHIINEFHRVAICNPEIEFQFINNDNNLYNLAKGNLKHRLTGLFSKNIGSQLIEVGVDTTLVKVKGYIGKPEIARKTLGEQFFFINNRYFKSNYFQKAIFSAYEQLLPQGHYPSFFIFLEIDPSSIDVNIHPSKTEVKFENEQPIWQIINAVARESLSKFAVTPSIIFDMEGAPEIPTLMNDTKINIPQISVDRNYNPFNPKQTYPQKQNIEGWEQLFEITNNYIPQESEYVQTTSISNDNSQKIILLKGKYIITPVKSGLMVIDIYRGRRRILFEDYLSRVANNLFTSQKLLHPYEINLNTADFIRLRSDYESLRNMGFEIDFLSNSIFITAMPGGFENIDPAKIIEEILVDLDEGTTVNIQRKLALLYARSESLKCDDMNEEEAKHFVDRLFASESPDISPEGTPVISIITMEEIAKKLN